MNNSARLLLRMVETLPDRCAIFVYDMLCSFVAANMIIPEFISCVDDMPIFPRIYRVAETCERLVGAS